jgi:hypothetical protein
MGARGAFRVVIRLTLPFVALFAFISGCQTNANTPSRAELLEHAEQVDDLGLTPPTAVAEVKITGSFPTSWTPLRVQKNAMYTHQQFRSPTRRTAVGLTYVRMPLPLSTKTLVWFAAGEVGKKVNDGKLIRQWTDELGREWFEAENTKYHMVGYVMTRGFDAWINYCGYRVTEPQEPTEIALGNKALDTILPSSVAPLDSRANNTVRAMAD